MIEYWAYVNGGEIKEFGALPNFWIDPYDVQHRLDQYTSEMISMLGWRKVKQIGYKEVDLEIIQIDSPYYWISGDEVYMRWNYSFLPTAKDTIAEKWIEYCVNKAGILASDLAFEYYATYIEALDAIKNKTWYTKTNDPNKYELIGKDNSEAFDTAKKIIDEYNESYKLLAKWKKIRQEGLAHILKSDTETAYEFLKTRML